MHLTRIHLVVPVGRLYLHVQALHLWQLSRTVLPKTHYKRNQSVFPACYRQGTSPTVPLAPPLPLPCSTMVRRERPWHLSCLPNILRASSSACVLFLARLFSTASDARVGVAAHLLQGLQVDRAVLRASFAAELFWFFVSRVCAVLRRGFRELVCWSQGLGGPYGVHFLPPTGLR